MTAGFEELQEQPGKQDVLDRLFVITDMGIALQNLVDEIFADKQGDFDRLLYLAHAGAERIINESRTLAAALDTVDICEAE